MYMLLIEKLLRLKMALHKQKNINTLQLKQLKLAIKKRMRIKMVHHTLIIQKPLRVLNIGYVMDIVLS